MKSSLMPNKHEYIKRLSYGSSKPRRQPTLRERWNSLKQSITTYLYVSSEPYVWETVDRDGHVQWNGYDPITHQSVQVDSEDEMRVWLEDRHYQYHLSAS